MSWNIFLGLVPFLLAKHLFDPKRKTSFSWALGLVAFVLFLPNAPYIFTDIIHLYYDSMNFTTAKALLAITAQFTILMLIGFWLFVSSYARFEKFILKKVFRKMYKHRYTVRLVSFTTISIGVYLGRFIRLNSWDAFFNPRMVFHSLKLLDIHALAFITLFTVLLFGIYVLYEEVLAKRIAV
jgi:uncharacterized membrane protein